MRMVTYNSFNSRPNDFRYRVIIPLSQWIYPATYKVIISWLIDKVEKAGFARDGAKRHGIDPTPNHAAAILYGPCRPADPRGTHFKVWNDKERVVFDPWQWANQLPESSETGVVKGGIIIPKADSYSASLAIQEWQANCRVPGKETTSSLP
jgi:hypothetical protein